MYLHLCLFMENNLTYGSFTIKLVIIINSSYRKYKIIQKDELIIKQNCSDSHEKKKSNYVTKNNVKSQ